ncbi:MAG: vitamin transporter [Alphaproteobacteria bacterium]|nr:vitamin transporter [Alphaproteobacteria bacterium]
MTNFHFLSSLSRMKPAAQSAALIIGLIFVAVNAGPAHAQTREIPQIVISANQVPLEASRVGASVTVISGDELRQKNVPTVGDALRSVPGVEVDQSGGRGTLTSVRIRGAESRQLMVILDGIEINQLGFPGFDFADLPTDDIERVEVIRGPQAGIYGANAHAGVISIVTRSGKGLAHPAIDAKIEGGTQRTATGMVNLRGAGGPVYGSVMATNYSTGGYNISRFGSENDGSRAGVVSAKGGIDFTPNFNVEGVFRYIDRSTDNDPQNFTFGSPTFGFIVDGPGYNTYKSSAGRVGPTLTLLDGHWIQSANYKIFREQTRGFGAGSAPSFGADGVRQTLDYKSTFLFDTNLFGGERHSLTGFVDNRRESYQQLNATTTYDKQRTGVAGEYVLNLPTFTTLSSNLRHDRNSGFANVDTWRFAASQRFPSTQTRLHSSVGKGVTDPDVFALFGSTFNLPNPALQPEQSVGWDAGLEQTLLGGRLVTDVTYFASDFTNKIELNFDPALGGLIYRNGIGAARRRGVEVSSQFEIFDWLTLKGAYTYTEAFNSAGMVEPRRPPHSGSLEATALFADRRARATVGATFKSVAKDFFFTPTDTLLVDLPAWATIRASLSYDLTSQLTAYVRAENVFNARYEEVFSYRAPGFAAFVGLKLRTGS